MVSRHDADELVRREIQASDSGSGHVVAARSSLAQRRDARRILAEAVHKSAGFEETRRALLTFGQIRLLARHDTGLALAAAIPDVAAAAMRRRRKAWKVRIPPGCHPRKIAFANALSMRNGRSLPSYCSKSNEALRRWPKSKAEGPAGSSPTTLRGNAGCEYWPS